jgi:hypothetical protein
MLAAMLAAAASAQEPVVPRFLDETAASGVVSVHEGGWEHMVGGGVAAFDCSGDGFPDLAFAAGAAAASLWINASPRGGPLRFEPMAGSGVEIEGVTGIWPLDADADGLVDLALLRLGEAVMLRGLGGCRFERANEAWGFDGGDHWHTAFSATWEEGEDWPTVAVGTYIDPAEEFFPWGSCTDNRLQRPDGDGWGPALALGPGHCALSMLFTDWARTGRADLRVSNDREYYKGGQEQLWAMEAVPRLYTEAEGWVPLRIWGMGIAARDVTGDGLTDYALTSMADNKLQTLAAPEQRPLRPAYVDVAFARGAIAQRPYMGGDVRPSTAWHAEWADVNNDRASDLWIAKGNVAEMPDFAALDPDNLLVQRPDGTFREDGGAAGIGSMGIGRGGTLADLNLDGLPDLVVTNRWTRAELFRNVTEGAGGWVALRLEMAGGNRDGVGSFIVIRTADGRVETREVVVGGGHGGGQLGWWHEGLGAGLGGPGAAELRVVWPDGTAGPWQEVGAGRFWVLSPGAAPREWVPPR